MDVRDRLRAWARASPRVLVVDAPGSRALRWAVEAELDRRGWRQALSPSDADLLLVLGVPGPELAAAVEMLWSQMPQPRRRVELMSEGDVGERLGAAARQLAAVAEPANETAGGPAPVQVRFDESAPVDHAGHQAMAGMDHSGHEGMDHSGHEAMAGMDHSGHEGMDHSDMGGGEHAGHHMHHGGDVAGLPMAQTAPDRDGLQLDVLRVSLGPVLPDWPTGLVLQVELQGDVVTGAQLTWLDDGDQAHRDPSADARRTALDHLASLLEVAGWSTAARDVRRARDGLASPDDGERAKAEQGTRRVLRRVRRSRALAWSLRGIGCLAEPERGTNGDVLDRLRRWCDVASDGAAVPAPGVPLDDVAMLLRGSEIAAARLIVASVEPQRSVARAEPEVVGA